MSNPALHTYLRDHYAGATAGLDVARRARDHQDDGTEFGEFFTWLAAQIDEDRTALGKIMDRLGVEPDPLKTATGWIAEKADRARKIALNALSLSSPGLDRIRELEMLLTGVQGKLALWSALEEIAPTNGTLVEAELLRLRERAEQQLDELTAQHRRAWSSVRATDTAAQPA